MNIEKITLELLCEENLEQAQQIERDDVCEEMVDTVDTLMGLTQYGLEHGCLGHTYVVRYEGACVGVILLGEAIEWETDPQEMKGVPFYRLMGFVIDKRYRSLGLGGWVLEEVIRRIYAEFGERPIALGVHQDNHAAAAFYLRRGFRKTDAKEGNDWYYLRYPENGV